MQTAFALDPDDEASKLPVGERLLAPTDVSQYIGLDRCERFLRFRLHERAFGRTFLYKFNVQGQEIPPLLSRTGKKFEEDVWKDLVARGATHDYGLWDCQSERETQNAALVQRLRDLEPGKRLLIYQPRLKANLGDWSFRGDADLLIAHKAADGKITLGIADVKSSSKVKVEHRLQVAFYRAMLTEILRGAGMADGDFDLPIGILYRGPADGIAADETEAAKLAKDCSAARKMLGLERGYFEIIEDARNYDAEVAELVTNPDSACDRIAGAEFDSLFYSLGAKCDSCLYQEFCFKDAHKSGDLSLVPHLTPRDKKALRSAGIRTAAGLAALKDYAPDGSLTTRPETMETLHKLTAAGVGPRLDELILRARRSHAVKLPAPAKIPGKGYTSLPFTSETHNPNLITIYLDAQTDYTQNRVYLVGAKIVAHEGGMAKSERSVVQMTNTPPDAPAKEAALFGNWISQIWRAVAELACLDAEGLRKAPIHLVFWNGYGESALMDALTRNLAALKEAAPLYDFIAQRAAFDSPLITFLDNEVRELRNYPMLCQSLQSVAQFLKFDWDGNKEGESFRKIFRERHFDTLGKNVVIADDGAVTEELFYRRSRFSSQIPLEYAYGAWGDLSEPKRGEKDSLASYRAVTKEQLLAFQRRRLDAMAHIAASFDGNKDTEKTPFILPELSEFTDGTTTYAEALREFVLVERHADLSEWKAARNLPAERRALLGETLIVRYVESDQEPEIVERNRENLVRYTLRQAYEAEFRAENPGKKLSLPKDQRDETKWDCEGMAFRLRVVTEGTEADLDTLLGMANVEEGKRFVFFPRWTTNGLLPLAERVPLNPTPKTLFWQSMVIELLALDIKRDADGRAVKAFAVIQSCGSRGGGEGFVFGNKHRPLEPDALYTLDDDPNDWNGLNQYKLCEALRQLEAEGATEMHPLYFHFSKKEIIWETPWPDAAAQNQQRFYNGLKAFHAANLLHDFEPGKEEFIAHHGGDSVLLVQGPPGTGKSYTSAFAILARMQGAMAAGIPLRVFLSCKTHSATDVLIKAVAEAQEKLSKLRRQSPEMWKSCFDPALLTLPLYRFEGKSAAHPGVFPVTEDKARGMDESAHFVLAATPGGIRKLTRKLNDDALFGADLCDLLVMDEASQLTLPEALMASLPLAQDGKIIVVGDPRQMPPIIHHAWDNEPRRALKEFEAFRSLFETLESLKPPKISFERSFRLHKTMAKFLRDEIYFVKDKINYHSKQTEILPAFTHDEAFVAAVLNPDYPLIVIVHDEDASQKLNLFERNLIAPILRALADSERYNLKADKGFGVVVPHRAQRVALRQAFPELSILDALTGKLLVAAVDTVERYQGDERDVILISATESDPEYLRASAAFLLDPRRLNVALSRAKKKMILVASRSVFSFFSSDEALYESALLWKNLLRRTCTAPLWKGTPENIPVKVWGSAISQQSRGILS